MTVGTKGGANDGSGLGSKKQSERVKEKPAFIVAADYLARGPKTEREVRQKLKSRGYSQRQIDDAVKTLNQYRYIDDGEYAKIFVSAYGTKYGAGLLKYKLAQKGVSQDAIESALSELPEENDAALCKKTAQNYIEKRRLQKKDRAKAANYLFSKGFSRDDINDVLSDGGIWKENEQDDAPDNN